jgi:hypothetical protein
MRGDSQRVRNSVEKGGLTARRRGCRRFHGVSIGRELGDYPFRDNPIIRQSVASHNPQFKVLRISQTVGNGRTDLQKR